MIDLTTPGEPDSPDDPDLAEVLDGGALAFGIAVVLSDSTREDIGEVAVLTVVSSVTAHTSDTQPGAESVEVLLSGMLAKGFASSYDLGELAVTALDTVGGIRGSDCRQSAQCSPLILRRFSGAACSAETTGPAMPTPRVPAPRFGASWVGSAAPGRR